MIRKISVLLSLVFVFASWLLGQSTFGGIVGVVKDPSQGEVAGAQVMLTSLEMVVSAARPRIATEHLNSLMSKPLVTNWSFTETVSPTTRLLPFR